jgi:cell shape-determining protein MreC
MVLSMSAAVSPVGDTSRTAPISAEQVTSLQQELSDNELQRRQLLIENARLLNEMKRLQRLADHEMPMSLPLVDFRSVTAQVLSRNGIPDRLSELLIDAGKSQGMRRSELVLEGAGAIIDQGQQSSVQAGEQVVAGRAVVGRIAKCGRWISLVQPITSSDFSARVQLVRRSEEGVYRGAEGLLAGDGQSACRITGIPYTESVTVGDDVFSSDIEGLNGPRFYYGTVVSAEFMPGGQWTVIVHPAASLNELDTVSVVQARLASQTVSQTGSGSDRSGATP